MMNKGTNVKNALENQRNHLNFRYIGVSNCSQQTTIQQLPMSKAREFEKPFL
jgi:hypothetical protein